MSEAALSKTLPLLPIKTNVLFPHVLLPLAVGRPASVAAVEAALATEEKELVIVAQRNPAAESPVREDLHNMGTRAVIRKMARGEGRIELIVQGIERVSLLQLEHVQPYIKAVILPVPLQPDAGMEAEALHREVLDRMNRMFSLLRPEDSLELTELSGNSREPTRLVYFMAPMLNLELQEEQALLEAPTLLEALRLLLQYLTHEIQVLEVRKQISSQTQVEMSKEQREYLLRKQLRAIQEELGEQNPEQAEIRLLGERLEKADLPDEVRREAGRELAKLERLPAAAPDYNVTRTWLDFIIELPWRKTSEPFLDLAYARQVLDEDHFDLEEVKERILEHLGVLKLNPDAKAPILCFLGPPGVGKTSLGQSIARALKRKFERMSLGGLHDEAELRGHRRTYIGAMPGRILQAVRRTGVSNPVLMLDEVDKLGRDYRGDPAAALMEILDPEQNREFRDNYLDLPFNLSNVFFIATANTLDTIPRPLLDRMEILRISGYTEEEKIEIAARYLIPRRLRESGLDAGMLTLPPDVIAWIISRYTREAGLRQLDRAIGRLARKAALKIAEGKARSVALKPEDLGDMLGPEVFLPEQTRLDPVAGVATGLAWTESGGDVLHIEATLLPGGTGLTLTGQLGEVMQESAKAAQSYIWAHAEDLGIPRRLFKDAGVHIHVPAGAIPKDGPSAGITMAAALASAYSKLPVRSDTAMTGEITLTGLVFPVGGIKEKVLAARRAGIRKVILPEDNRKDLRELPESARKEMTFTFASRIEEVLLAAIPELSRRLPVADAGS